VAGGLKAAPGFPGGRRPFHASSSLSIAWCRTCGDGQGPIRSDHREVSLLERAVFLSVLHRLMRGGSDLAADRWREE
jgi:hypothetical protein